MPKTRAQLVNRAWGIIVSAGEGETPSSDDYNKVDSIVDSALAQLAAGSVVAAVNSDQIDEAIYLPLARYLANEASVDFSQPYNEAAKVSSEAQIRLVLTVAAIVEPVRTTYY